MKLRDVLKMLKPAASIAASLIPGGAAAVTLVNTLLPDKDKLPMTATGQHVIDTYSALTPAEQLQIIDQEVKLEIALDQGWTDRYTTMTQSDGHSTRPRIALMLAKVLSFEILAFTVWCFCNPAEMKSPILWTVFTALTAPPVGILTKYFGDLKREHQQRTNIAVGVPSPLSSSGLLGRLFK